MFPFFHRVASVNQPVSSVQIEADPPAAVAPVARKDLLLLTVGFAITLLFPLIYLIEGVTRPGYNPWRETISSLSFGPTGWIQQLNFALCGVGVLVMALAWRKMLAGGVCATWYPIIRVVEGLGLIAIGIATMDPWHTAFMIVIVQAMSIDLFVIARRFWKQPGWHGWTLFTVLCALWPMLVMPLFGMALNPHGALAGYDGFFERIATNADTVWTFVLIVRLWTRRKAGI